MARAVKLIGRGMIATARVLLALVGIVAVFVTALVAAVFLHLNLPVTHRVVKTEVSAFLATLLTGKIIVDDVAAVGLRGASGIAAHVETPVGREVVRVSDMNAEISVKRLVQSILSPGPLEVRIARVHMGRVDVSLDTDENGALAIAKVFIPRPKPPAPTTSENEPSRKVIVTLDHIDATEVHVHRRGKDAALLGAHVDRLDTSLIWDSHMLTIPARAQLGSGTFDVLLHVTPDSPPGEVRLDGSAHLRHVDARLALPALPTTDASFDATFDLSLGAGLYPTGKAHIVTQASTVNGELVPPSVIDADCKETWCHATAKIDEVGAPTNVEARIDEHKLEATVSAKLGDVHDIPRVATAMHVPVPRGRADVEASGTLNLDTKALDANAHVVASKVQFMGVVAQTADARAHAFGQLDALELDAKATTTGFAVQGFDAERVDASTHLSVANATRLVEPDATITRAGVTVHAHAKRVEIDGDRIDVHDAVVQGLGDAIAVTGSRTPQSIELHAKAPRIDVAAVGRVLRMSDDLRGGNMTLDADATLAGSATKARVTVAATGVSAYTVEKGDIEAHVTLDRRVVDMEANARVPDVGNVHVKTQDLLVDGNAATLDAWRRARGRLDLDGTVDLCRLADVLPKDSLAHVEICGALALKGHVARGTPTARPDAEVSVSTRGLVYAARAPSPDAPTPMRISGVDVETTATVDGGSGHAALSVKLVDEHGTLATADLSSKALDAMVFGDLNPLQHLESVPLEAHVEVPPRALKDFPPMLHVPALVGVVNATVDFTGTARAPKLVVKAHAANLHTSLPGLDVTAHYDGKKGDARITGDVRSGQSTTQPVEITAQVAADINAILATPHGEEPPWSASAKAAFQQFPVQAVASMFGARVRGKLDGEIVVERFHENASVTAKAVLTDATVQDAKMGKLTIAASAKNGGMEAKVSLLQEDGQLDVDANGGLKWGAALVPEIDEGRQFHARVTARALRANAFLPFVSGTLDDLDGRLDGQATIDYDPASKKPTLQGSLQFHDGLAHVPALGQDLKDIRARVNMAADGTMRIDDIAARGVSGQVTGSARVRMAGLNWSTADATFSIPKNAPFDLTLQGEPIGEVYGDTKVTARNDPAKHHIDVRVDIPSLSTKLPSTSRNDVQRLGESPEDIHVGTFKSPKRFTALPMSAKEARKSEIVPADGPSSTITLVLALREVTVVRGNQLSARIGGDLRVNVASDVQVTGQLELRGGTLDVQGKQFTIQKGTVTFQGKDPANPTVVATAEWTAADGTQVFADFIGPVRSGKLTLRAEPSRSRDEILSLILFGTADASVGASASSSGGSGSTSATAGNSAAAGAAGTAAGVGASFIAQGVTEAIDDLSGVQAQARLDTTNAQNPRPEIGVQVARDLTVRVSHVIGTPNAAEPDLNFVTVEWRLSSSWTLETTLGDHGRSQVDVVWQRRY